MVYETISKNRLDGPPPRINRHQLIDPPQCSPSESDEVLANFRRRLEAIVAYCDRIGTLPILIIPPSNEGAGAEPVRPPRNRLGRRETLGCRDLPGRAPSRGPTPRGAGRLRVDHRPRAGVRRGPFPARPPAGSGRPPRRGESPLHRGPRRRRPADPLHDGLSRRLPRGRLTASPGDLIDGPAVLRDASPHHILDDHMIQDVHHPNLSGAAVLAEAVVRALRNGGRSASAGETSPRSNRPSVPGTSGWTRRSGPRLRANERPLPADQRLPL